MGFTDLALVSPTDPKVLNRHKVIQRASGAKDVLANTTIFTTLEDALHDRNVVCGTGMPMSMFRTRVERTYLEPRAFFDTLVNNKEESRWKNGDQLRLALVFGSEREGTSYYTTKVAMMCTVFKVYPECAYIVNKITL